MRTISLTQGQSTIVDDEDYEILAASSWYYKKGYAARNTKGLNRTTVRMHQDLLPCEVGFQVDHINGNKLDNRRCNLRRVTLSGQARNVGMKRNNTSGFKGVSYYTKNGKWQAHITFWGKCITIGYYFTAETAARAYDKEAIKLFGEAAKTNEMLGNYTK